MWVEINIAANAVIVAACFWALFSERLVTRTGGSIILMAIALGAFGNVVGRQACHYGPQVVFNVACAFAAMWIFWRVQVNHRTIERLGI